MSEVLLHSHESTVLKPFDAVPNTRAWSDHIEILAPSGAAFDTTVFAAEMEIFDEAGASCLVASTAGGTLVSTHDGLRISIPANVMGGLKEGHYRAEIRLSDKNGLVGIDPVSAILPIVAGGHR